MSVKPYLWLIAILCAISTVVIYWVAPDYHYMKGLVAAAVFASSMGGIAMQMNAPYLTGTINDNHERELAAIAASRSNAQLLALTFFWGAVVMIASYFLTDLYWYHAWQYASIMTLLAGALAGYAYLITTEDHVLRKPTALKVTTTLAIVQAIATLVGLIFLVSSGKLHAGRSDWVANIVFFCGGFAVVTISTLAAATQLRIQRR
ncbi:MAG: hypothetical protein ACRBCJ_11590 [Hyphomicrobiaceae bacterium]